MGPFSYKITQLCIFVIFLAAIMSDTTLYTLKYEQGYGPGEVKPIERRVITEHVTPEQYEGFIQAFAYEMVSECAFVEKYLPRAIKEGFCDIKDVIEDLKEEVPWLSNRNQLLADLGVNEKIHYNILDIMVKHNSSSNGPGNMGLLWCCIITCALLEKNNRGSPEKVSDSINHSIKR